MKKKNIDLSLNFIIPLIFSGISILSAIVSFQTAVYYLTRNERDYTFQIIILCLSIGFFVFLLGFLILKIIFKPIRKFIKEAEKMKVLPVDDSSGNSKKKSSNGLEYYSMVFEQLTDVLNSVEAKELFPEVIGQSKVMRGIFSNIIKVAQTDTTVLITGESGTGKEVIANSIFNHSRRSEMPFVKLNCVSIPGGLVESALFGHEKGSFTGAVTLKRGKFEMADKGTIFLDEIGDVPLEAQAKLLRLIQEREFERVGGVSTIKCDVRIIAATNKNLVEMVQNGQFREDLFFRLNVFPIHVPPLRERKEDISILIDSFLANKDKSYKISPEVLQLFINYDWPGNIRELQNTIERASVLAENELILPKHLPFDNVAKLHNEMTPHIEPGEGTIDEKLGKIEKNLIIDALVNSGCVQTKAAEILGINQRSLWHRVKKHDIDVGSLKKDKKRELNS